jgi:transposase
LEDANLKLASVATDVLGVSGRDMLAALARGETDAAKMAELARGRLQAKREELQQALTGHVTEHHRYLLKLLLDNLAHLEGQIADLDARVMERLRPFLNDATQDRLDRVPGVNRRTIENVVAEIGVDMSRFPTDGHLCSWAGICPGNDKSAGRQKRTSTTQGNHWLKRALVEAARAASRQKSSYFNSQYHRLAARRGPNRAAIAVAHSLLEVFYHLLSDPTLEYHELGVTYFDQLNPERQTRHLVKRLEAQGYTVTLTRNVA